MTVNARFESLRELLYEKPDHDRWEKLCVLFNEWPEDNNLTEAIEYAKERLESWSDRDRRSPEAWVLQLYEGRDRECFELIRTFTPVKTNGLADCFRRALDAVYLINVVEIDVVGYRVGQIGQEGFAALMKWPYREHLHTLKLSHQNIGDVAARWLAKNSGLSNLKSLDLTKCRIGPEGLKAILDSEHLDGLEELNLSKNPDLGDEGARMLLSSPKLNQLEYVDVEYTEINDDALFRKLRHHPTDIQTYGNDAHSRYTAVHE